MAVIVDFENKVEFQLIPIRNLRKGKKWFSVNIQILIRNKLVKKVSIDLHLNDFIHLINGLKEYRQHPTNEFEFNPTEPNLQIKIAQLGNSNFINLYIREGSMYESVHYVRYDLFTSDSAINEFREQLASDLMKIDSKMKLETIPL